jgi:predicted MPP superfamily phosphohydrolase
MIRSSVLLLPVAIVALFHLYLWRRLVRDLALPLWTRRLATVALIMLGASIPVSIVFLFFVSRTGRPWLTALGFGWLGVMAYLTAMLLVWDSLRWLLRRAPRAQPPAADDAAVREPRRVFVARAVAGSALLASGTIGAFGVRSAVWEITTPEVPVVLPRWPRALDGFSIALLTDVHIGPMLDGRFLRQLVERTNRLRPDLIAIGGDLVDGRVREIGAQVAELRRLRARYGVYFVTGNHEYYSGAADWIAFLSQLGVRVLKNEHVPIGDTAQFDLAGVFDRGAGRYGQAPDAIAATRGRDADRALVMLAHQPIQIYESARVGAGLQLSGHTHGGQLQPFGELARLRQPYLAGLHRHEPDGAQIYVSCGTGFWGPPMRVLAPAEISWIRLSS